MSKRRAVHLDISSYFIGETDLNQVLEKINNKSEFHPLSEPNVLLLQRNERNTPIEYYQLLQEKGKTVKEKDLEILDELIREYFGCSFNTFIKITNDGTTLKKASEKSDSWAVMHMCLSDTKYEKYYPYYHFKEYMEIFNKINDKKQIHEEIEQMKSSISTLASKFDELDSFIRKTMENLTVLQSQPLSPSPKAVSTFQFSKPVTSIVRTQNTTEELKKEGRVVNPSGEEKLKNIEKTLKMFRNNCMGFIINLNVVNDDEAEFFEAMIHNAISSGFATKHSKTEIMKECITKLNSRRSLNYLANHPNIGIFLETQIKLIYEQVYNANSENITLQWFDSIEEISPYSEVFRSITDLDNRTAKTYYTCILPAIFYGKSCTFIGNCYQFNKK